MQKLGDSLLALATLRDYVPVKKLISISDLFEDVQMTFKASLMEKGVELVVESQNEVFEGQEDLIKSLLLNLVANALKACAARSGRIYLKVQKVEAGFILLVEDNGCGIPSSEISKLGEPFFRVDKARNRKDGGASLGLALCRQIMDIHKGEMVIESFLGEGTVVKLWFRSERG